MKMQPCSNTLTLIIKLTTQCNLACEYCYMEKDSNYDSIMPLDILEDIISKAQRDFKKVNYVWHGGEPLLVGKNYFKYIHKLQQYYKKDSSQEIDNSIQTNGTLLTKEYLEKLITYGFDIGISYDANVENMNPSRPFISGEPTQNSVEKSLNLIKQFTGTAGAICVVTKNNAHNPKAILDKLVQIGLSGISFIPFKKTPYSADLSIDPLIWSDFLINSFEYWLYSSEMRNIEPIVGMVKGLLGMKASTCTYTSPCFKRYLALYPDGTLFPCSSFTGSEMKLGNIKNQSFVDILTSKKILSLRERWASEIKTHCGKCKFVSICNGACAEYAYMDTGDLKVSEDECIARYRTFSHIAKRLNEILPEKILKLVEHPMLAL